MPVARGHKLNLHRGLPGTGHWWVGYRTAAKRALTSHEAGSAEYSDRVYYLGLRKVKMYEDVGKETGDRLIKFWSSGLVLENDAPQFVDVVDKTEHLLRG